MEEIREQLRALAEEDYRKFAAGLLPGTDNILGVRLPVLRRMAKQIAGADWRSFEKMQPQYFEEVMLQGFVLGCVRAEEEAEWEELLAYIAAFIPKITNWSLCDSFCSSLKFTKRRQEWVWHFIMPYLHSGKEYELRFGIVMLLFYYIEDTYIAEVLDILKAVRHEGYYAKMAVAWALSICYVAYPQQTEGVLSDGELDDFTHNKTIQKICESRQVSPEAKQKLRERKRQL